MTAYHHLNHARSHRQSRRAAVQKRAPQNNGVGVNAVKTVYVTPKVTGRIKGFTTLGEPIQPTGTPPAPTEAPKETPKPVESKQTQAASPSKGGFGSCSVEMECANHKSRCCIDCYQPPIYE